MWLLRIPLFALMGGVIIAACDLAIGRVVFDPSRAGPYVAATLHLAVFVFGTLPLANLLILIALIRLPTIVRRQVNSPFFFGFEAFGWGAVLAFCPIALLAPTIVGRFLDQGFRAAAVLASPLDKLAWIDWTWAQEVLETGTVIMTFGVPELIIALVGGWLARKARLSVRVEFLPAASSEGPLRA